LVSPLNLSFDFKCNVLPTWLFCLISIIHVDLGRVFKASLWVKVDVTTCLSVSHPASLVYL
jgi:hypothetical protein